jgi:hypothetical protein
VASSSTTIFARSSTARAMQMSCRWPWDQFSPAATHTGHTGEMRRHQ